MSSHNMATRAEKLRLLRQLLTELGDDALEEPAPARPLAELVVAYLTELHHRDVTELRQEIVALHLERLFGRVELAQDLTPDLVKARLRAVTKRYRLRPQTANSYRSSARAFARWLVAEGELSANVVDRVDRRRVTEEVYPRRAIELEELERLVAAVPLYRGSCYLVAATSGLRRVELARLEIPDLDLTTHRVRIRAAAAKNRTKAVLPLCDWAVELLREWVGRARRGPVWHRRRRRISGGVGVPHVRTLWKDLRAIGVEPVAWEGRIDFHALRVSCATILDELGVSPSVIQEIMRHADPRTTKHYTRVRERRLRAAVKRFDAARDSM